MTEQVSSSASVAQSTGAATEAKSSEQTSSQASSQKADLSSPSLSQTFKVKDGRELPLEKILNEWEAAAASTKRYQQASQLEKQVKALFEGLSKKDVQARNNFISTIGEENFRELAEQYLIEKLEFESLPEPERNYRLEKKKAEDLEKKLKEREEKDQEGQRATLQKMAAEEIDNEVSDYLKSSKIKTPRLVARALETILANQKKGAKIPFKDAWVKAEDDIKEDVKSYIRDLPIEDRKKLFTDEEWKSLRKADVEAARSNFHSNKPAQTREPTERPRKEKLTLDEWMAKKERQFGIR